MNTLKTMVLMLLLTVLAVSIGSLVGGAQGATVALAAALALHGVAYFYSDRLVLKMHGAQPVSEDEAPDLYDVVRVLAARARIPLPKVYLMTSPQPNAFATGRNPSHAVIAVTTSLLNLLSREELIAVLAHELSHIRHRDILVGTIAAVFAGAVTYLAQMGQWSMVWGRERGGIATLLPVLAMMVLAPIAALLIQMAISRSREYLADDGGAELSEDPAALAAALRKLDWAARSVPVPVNPATAHLFIVNPLRGRQMASLFSTHPPIEDRIARLEARAPSLRRAA